MHIFNRRKLQASAVESAKPSSAVANSVPTSGLRFVDNSKGALQAVEEVADVLDETFKQIEFEGSASEQLEQYQARLNGVAERYANLSVDSCSSKESWNCKRAIANLVSIAWKCASGTYDPSHALELGNHRFRTVKCLPPSFGGTVKATTMTLVESSGSLSDTSTSLPVLVVAIRGTASTVDIMVNLNTEPRIAGEFLPVGLAVHAGFLGAAQALEPHVSTSIAEVCLTGQAKHVIFTGHSAGAAVASLLFLHYRKKYADALSVTLSCILFGCPPTFQPAPSLPSHVLKPAAGELWLNIINEYDVVSRADKPYVRSLVDLFRLGYEKPPLDGESDSLFTLSCTSDDTKTIRSWIVPSSEFRHGGDIIVLQMSRPIVSTIVNKVLEDDSFYSAKSKFTVVGITNEQFP
ncbi:Alpha/Beta hydrolase protein [Phyllosticta capitalensis]|uniref:Alpha/Beta hydrolase protein n=1 Tax=Phyllosticta capitalensis TaxID=121624 RepID=A0ABR1YDL4_9PEZI